MDDEILIADGLRQMLEEAFNGRAQVQACYSGAEALRLFNGKPADVMMTDINMPDISGLELHRRVA